MYSLATPPPPLTPNPPVIPRPYPPPVIPARFSHRKLNQMLHPRFLAKRSSMRKARRSVIS